MSILPLTSESALSAIAMSFSCRFLKCNDFKVGIIAVGSADASAALHIIIEGIYDGSNVPKITSNE